MNASSLFAASLALAIVSIAPATAAPLRAERATAAIAEERKEGCSVSNQYAYSAGCKNPAHFKTYSECLDAGLKAGWRDSEMAWYCTSLRLP